MNNNTSELVAADALEAVEALEARAIAAEACIEKLRVSLNNEADHCSIQGPNAAMQWLKELELYRRTIDPTAARELIEYRDDVRAKALREAATLLEAQNGSNAKDPYWHWQEVAAYLRGLAALKEQNPTPTAKAMKGGTR